MFRGLEDCEFWPHLISGKLAIEAFLSLFYRSGNRNPGKGNDLSKTTKQLSDAPSLCKDHLG